LFSPGGSVTAGLGIYDTMMYIKPDVSTWCIGQACSMGSVLLAAGTKGKRHALPHSRIMIHQPSGGMQVIITNIISYVCMSKVFLCTLSIYFIYQRNISKTLDYILMREELKSM